MEFLKQNRRFSFCYNGTPVDLSAAQTDTEETASTLTTRYRLEDGLLITNVATVYPDYHGYEWVTYYENTGTAPSGILSDIRDCDIELPFAHDDPYRRTALVPDPEKGTRLYAPIGSSFDFTPYEEFYCSVDDYCTWRNQFSHHLYPGEQHRFTTNAGRSCDRSAPFFNVNRQGVGFVGAIGWSGQWDCTVGRTEDTVTVRAGLTRTHFRLLPGEKIRTASFVLMPYTGDFTASQNKWRRFVKAHFSLIGQEGRPDAAPLCAAIWGGMESAAVLERVDIIKQADIPLDYVWMDAGWYGGDEVGPSPDEFEGDWSEHTGDWRVNRAHPGKLLDVSDAIHKAGKKFLLWFENERVSPKAPVAAEHPDYLLHSPDPERPDLLMDLGSEEAWQYSFAMLSEKIESLHIDCYRCDFNFDPYEYWTTGDSEDRVGMTEIRYIMGLYRLWDALLARFPHLLIDNCASGGHRIDIELLRRSVPLWRSDANCPADQDPEVNQVHNVSYGTWMPYSGTGCGRDLGDTYRFRSAYTGALSTNFTFSQRENLAGVLKREPEKLAWWQKMSAEYRQLRPYFYEDIYPLTQITPNKDVWFAIQYDRPSRQDGLVQVFKREKAPYTQACYPLRGLCPDAVYTVTDIDDGATVSYTGQELTERGLPLTVCGQRVAKIYRYCKQ